MEKDWPPLKECAQWECGMLQRYMKKFEWEEDESIGDDKEGYFYMSDSDSEDCPPLKITYKYSTLRTFLHQVRTSRGYDVNVRTPTRLMNSPFWFGNFEGEQEQTVELALKYISTRTKKTYKHVRNVKSVYSFSRVLLLTFVAKEDAPDAEEETFLATAYTPSHVLDEAELLECIIKPDGPAPWNE